MAGIKIVDLPAVGRDLAATDLFEMSLAGGTGSRKITGQEIINAIPLGITGTGTTNFLSKFTSASVLGDSLISSDANVIAINSAATGAILFNNAGTTRWQLGGGGGNVDFSIYNYTTGSYNLYIRQTTGNVLIGTTTDAGYKLDVNGTARVQGNLFEVTNGTNKIAITSTQISCLAGVSVSNLNIVAGPISAPNSILGIGTTVGGGSTTILRIGEGNATNASGIVTIIESPRGFAPTSGTATFSFATWNGTINQTGGANGITRGLFIDPTLTAAADFRAIETTRGNVLFGTTSGNVGIGTSSPAQKLDVNGNTQITGNLIFPVGERFIQYGTTSSFFVGRDAAGVYLAYGFGSQQIDIGSSSTGNIRLRTTANVILDQGTSKLLIGTATDAGFRLDVNGTARVVNTLSVNTGNVSGQGIQMSSDSNMGIFNNGGVMQLRQYSNSFELAGGGTTVFLRTDGNRINTIANYGIALGTYGVTTANASAILEAYSTTKGFLPPRMTQTQRNAIASPAIGLEIYQTDATEGKYIYKSSGWTYIG